MLSAFFITFRESLEAAVVVGILLATLRAFQAEKERVYIWSGVGAGILASIIFAWIFNAIFGGFSGPAEKLYEGILMFFAAGLITQMVFWMMKNARSIKANIQARVQDILSKGELWAIAALAFFSVVREGVETVIFFEALEIQSDGMLSLWGGVLGIIAAILLAMIIFRSTKKISPARLFQVTGFILIFIAGGLLAHGIVELQGANVLPIIIKPVFDLSNVLSESEGIGLFLKALFGYDANPSLIAVIAYVLFMVISLWYWFSLKNNPQESA